jgi:hypothetical protein
MEFRMPDVSTTSLASRTSSKAPNRTEVAVRDPQATRTVPVGLRSATPYRPVTVRSNAPPS